MSTKIKSFLGNSGPFKPLELLESRRLMSGGGSIALGSTVSGTIAQAAQMDTYQFTVPAGATVNVNSNAAAIDSGYNANFKLFNSDGARLGLWYGSSSQSLQNLAAGTYTIDVQDAGGTRRGSYMIGVEGISPISDGATPLTSGGIVSSKITGPIDVQEYTFNVATDGSNIELNTNAQAIDSGFNANFTLYGSSGAKLQTWYGNGSVNLANLSAGTYMVKVNDASLARRGTFSIGEESISGDFSRDATRLSQGKVTATQTIASPLDTREFTFSLSDATNIFIDTGASKVDSGFNARFVLYKSDGSVVSTWYGNGSQKLQALPAGDYMIKASDASFASRGTFAIGLESLSGTFSSDAGKLASGGIVGAKSSSGLDVAEYKLTLAQSSSTIQLDTLSSAIDSGYNAKYSLFNSSGAVIDTWYGSAERVEANLPAGNYMVSANDANLSRRGAASIGLEFHSASFSADAIAMNNAKTASVKLTSAMDVKQFVFAATSSKLSLTSSFKATDRGFNPTFTMYDTSGAAVASWTGALNKSVTVKKGRTYMIQVQDIAMSRRGTVNLTLKNVKPVSLAPTLGTFDAGNRGSFAEDVRLRTIGTTSPFNDVQEVDFWKESNGRKGLQTGAGGDTFIGASTESTEQDGATDVWAQYTSVPTNSFGTYRFYAQAVGSTGLTSPVATGDVVYT